MKNHFYLGLVKIILLLHCVKNNPIFIKRVDIRELLNNRKVLFFFTFEDK